MNRPGSHAGRAATRPQSHRRGGSPRRQALILKLAPAASLLACLGAGCGESSPGALASTPQKVLAAPAPASLGNSPVVEESRSQGDAISASLAVIHDQLRDMKAAYRDRAKIEGDLKRVAERMRPLIAASRSHCGEMRRAAEDLRFQLPLVRDGYAMSAASYRQRAATHQDPDNRAITLKLADEFDRLAVATPARLEALEGFLKELRTTEEYLAETDRCLRDTAAALAVFSAQATVPEVPVEAKAFSHRLGQFIEAALEYEDKLLQKPRKPAAPEPAAAPEPPGPGDAAGELPGMTLEEFRANTARAMAEAEAKAKATRLTERRPVPRRSIPGRTLPRFTE